MAVRPGVCAPPGAAIIGRVSRTCICGPLPGASAGVFPKNVLTQMCGAPTLATFVGWPCAS